MKILMTALLAATGLAAAVPAAAQDRGYYTNAYGQTVYGQNGTTDGYSNGYTNAYGQTVYGQNGYDQSYGQQSYGQTGYGDRDAQERWAREHANQGQYGYTTRTYGQSAVSFQAGEQLYVRLIQRINQEVSDGDMDRTHAWDYRRQADMIRRHAWHARQRGAYDPQEVGARYAQLGDRIQTALERGRYADNRYRDGYTRY